MNIPRVRYPNVYIIIKPIHIILACIMGLWLGPLLLSWRTARSSTFRETIISSEQKALKVTMIERHGHICESPLLPVCQSSSPANSPLSCFTPTCSPCPCQPSHFFQYQSSFLSASHLPLFSSTYPIGLPSQFFVCQSSSLSASRLPVFISPSSF